MDETIIFLNTLCAEIEFSKMSILKILSYFTKEASMKSLCFLNDFSDGDVPENFHSVWKHSINTFPYYKSEEKEKMLQLGSFLGTTDVENQLKTIRLYLFFFESYRDNAVNEYEKYGKISALFGLFIGASVFLLLI